eukprot:805706_1
MSSVRSQQKQSSNSYAMKNDNDESWIEANYMYIAIGCFAVLLLAIIAIVIWYRVAKKKKAEEKKDMEIMKLTKIVTKEISKIESKSKSRNSLS